ncbi:uncharacterized protein [Aphelocoma coerulescens]|uniref:uncharacterized protein n=1 Tax=Aphelocoma coerulescens TaxID=39617 RepID=UPI003604E1AE
MGKVECHFITAQVRFVERHIYNRQQYVHLDSDVRVFVGDTPDGEKVARYWNSYLEWMKYMWAAVHTCCRHNYEVFTPFLMGRRGAAQVVPGPGGALRACGGHRHCSQWELDPPAPGAAGNSPPARGHFQLPGGAQQPGAAPELALGDATGPFLQQDADGDWGLCVGLCLPGAGARLLPVQAGQSRHGSDACLQLLIFCPPIAAYRCLFGLPPRQENEVPVSARVPNADFPVGEDMQTINVTAFILIAMVASNSL